MFTNLGYVNTRTLRVALVVALGATLAALVTVALVAVSPAARAADGNCQTSGSEVVCTFDTPGTSIWTVPAGVQQATFDVFGAQGGHGGESILGGNGGLGGEVKATFSVEPTTQYEINVGGQGDSGDNDFGGGVAGGINGGGKGGALGGGGGGGGGGGASDVRNGNFALADRIMVAGGGGGGGGGSGRICPNNTGGGHGGDGSGGNLVGVDGQSPFNGNGGGGGGGGTDVDGGFGGSTDTAAGGSFGGSGTLGFGGPGGSSSDPTTNPCISGGGGGGGGYYGGGGGGSGHGALFESFSGGGGGGGSGFLNLGLPSLSNVESNSRVQFFDGLIRITYTLPTPTSVLIIGDTSVTEGNSGTSNATFTVSLSEPSAQPVTVDYATSNDTATAGTDYVTTTGTLTFAPGETTQALSVMVNGDTQNEPNETFFVNLSNPTNTTISDSRGIGTITNDDQPPDTTAPMVSTTSPGDNGTMGKADLVTATFSKEVKGVSEQTFFLKQYTLSKNGRETYVPVTAKVTTPNGITAVLNPTKDLARGTYQATITNGVTDKADNALVPKTWKFSVTK